MKTFTIALCLLLVFLPAGAQEISPHRTPNFYVPYSVRDAHSDAVDLESSSTAEMRASDPGQHRNPMATRRYSRRAGRFGGSRSGHGPRFQPKDSTAGAVVAAVVVAGLAVAAAIAGDR